MRIALFIIVLFISPLVQASFQIEPPKVTVAGVSSSVEIPFAGNEAEMILELNGDPVTNYTVSNGKIQIPFIAHQKSEMTVRYNDVYGTFQVNPIPLWMSALPPLMAIILALLFQEVISSLFIGLFVGTAIMGYYGNGVSGIFSGFLLTIEKYVVNAINDWSHIAVIVFSMTIAAIVSIISKNGGMRGVVNRLEPYAKNPRSGQLVIWFMGVLIFFDDYANTLVVGNTMRPVADRLHLSREKLAYLVDSTAAPVASVAFITTWIGAELGYIETGLSHLPTIQETPYSVFLNSLQYAFYPVFTLIFMLFLIWRKRDFGPMLTAEKKARKGEVSREAQQQNQEVSNEFEPIEGVKPRSFNAILPILVVIVGAIVGMWATGMDATQPADLNGLSTFRKISMVIGNSDSFTALIWSSLGGAFVAIVLTISQRIMNLEDTINAGINGFKTMVPAIVILILAWALAGITQDMHTAVFLQGLWSSALSPIFIPAVVFILSGLVSFSTGSSWGTMAILYPLLLPASYQIAIDAGMDHAGAMVIFYNVVSVILAGSVFGDHCSPISDTTILSSLATNCNHLKHVKTQMPYAMTVGVVSILIGSIPAAMGVSSIITMPVGLLILYGVVHFFGKETESH